MEFITAKRYDIKSGELVLYSKEDLGKVYTLLEDNTNFILTYNKESTLVIADHILAKVKNGEIVLGAEEE